MAEIDAVTAVAAAQGRSELSYIEDFDKFSYTYGFNYETLRLYPGVTLITKVCLQPQPIATPGRPTILPADTRVYLSAPAFIIIVSTGRNRLTLTHIPGTLW